MQGTSYVDQQKFVCFSPMKRRQGVQPVCSKVRLLHLRHPGMLLLEECVRGTSKLGRAGLELLALEAVSVGSFGRKLLWLTASGTKAL